jgi:hypothetical protein
MNATQRRERIITSVYSPPMPDNRANCFPPADDAFALSIQGRKRLHNADQPQGGDRRQARLSNVFERALPRTSYGFGDSTFC